MSEYNVGIAIDSVFADAFSNDTALIEDTMAVAQAAIVQKMAPGHWLTAERLTAGYAFRRGEIDVPEYARRIGQTPEQVRDHFLKCGMTEDGEIPEDGLNMATFDREYVERPGYGRFGGDASS